MPIAAGPRSRTSAACVGATSSRTRRSGGRRPPTTTAATKIRPTTTPAGSPPGRTGLDPGSSTFAGRATPSLPGTEDGVTADATPPDPRLAVDLDPLEGGSTIGPGEAPGHLPHGLRRVSAWLSDNLGGRPLTADARYGISDAYTKRRTHDGARRMTRPITFIDLGAGGRGRGGEPRRARRRARRRRPGDRPVQRVRAPPSPRL